MKISKRSKITSSKETADRKTDRRIFPTNVRYKGYMIRLDRGGDGYNVYDKHGELEDAGYASIEKAKEFVDELVAENKGHVVEASVNERQKEIDNKIREKIMSIKDVIADYAQSGEFYDSESGRQRFFSIPISRYADSLDYSCYEKEIRSVLPNARVYSNFDDYEIIVDVSRCYENVNSSTEVYSDNSNPHSEYEYRKNVYLKRKHEFETLGEADNNDVLSREEKMNLAKAEMDKVAPKSVNSASTNVPEAKMIDDLDYFYEVYPEDMEPILIRNGANPDKDNWLDGCNIPQAYNEAVAYFEYNYDNDDEYSELDTGVGSRLGWSNYIQSGIYEETEDPKWICLDIKHVRDSDGMLTDYALYTTKDEDKYICMFGDADVYAPDEMYADAEFDTEDEALEWFENYVGPGDEEDEEYEHYDILESTEAVNSSYSPDLLTDTEPEGSDLNRYEFLVKRYGREEDKETITAISLEDAEDQLNSDGYVEYWDYLPDFNYDIEASYIEYEEDLPQAEQEYDSAKTSINSNKLPAIYHMITLPEGSVGIDYGGGKFDNAVEALAEQGVTLHVYDPYNRSQQHNRAAIKALRANGGADFAINSNVLNVIKEPEARLNVLENIKKITKPGAPIYITVYEGSGKGNEGVTKSGYQLNRKTADYLDEIKEVFPDAKRKGKLIIAHNTQSASSSTNVNSSKNIRPIDELNDVTDQLRDDLIQKLVDVMSSTTFGFTRNEAVDYSRVDIRFDDDENRIEVEVGAEVSYDGLMRIAQELDPIIQSYDQDAYFDAEDAGLLIAVIPYESLRKHMDVNSAVSIPEPSLDPPEYDDPEEGEETVEAECDINQLEITVDEDGSWEYQRDDFLDEMLTAEDEITSEEYDVYIRDRSGLIEDFDSIVEPNIPGVPGTYLISCHVKMVYDVTGVEIVREYQGKDEDGDPIVDEDYYTGSADVEFNRNESYITNFYSEEI